MKLYTKKQVKRMIDLARFTYHSEDKILFSQKPIELPSDEVIEEISNLYNKEIECTPYEAFEIGAKWMREQLTKTK